MLVVPNALPFMNPGSASAGASTSDASVAASNSKAPAIVIILWMCAIIAATL